MKKNIALVGFMGAGKSVVANRLAKLLHREVVSTDKLIEQKEGRLIVNIFKESGETYFRELELDIIKDLSAKEDLIIDCGGGVVLNRYNVENLKSNGILFYLYATPEVIYQRIKDEKHRPLLNVKDPLKRIKELLKARTPFYAQADYTIDTCPRSIDETVSEVLKLLEHD